MWYHEHEDGVMLQIKVVPHAKQNRIIGVTGDFLKIAVTAAPEKGKANEIAVSFLSSLLGVPQSSVRLARGAHQPTKLIFVPMLLEQVQARLTSK